MRLTLILLISLAATSIIGTLIPQNADPVTYVKKYGVFLYRFFAVLDLYDMYDAWWFLALMLLLVLNIVVCSIERLERDHKIIFKKNPPLQLNRFRNLSKKEIFDADDPPQDLGPVYEKYISQKFAAARSQKTDQGLCIWAEKGRWTRLGVYTVHLSVVILLIGGLIGSIWGFEGFVKLPEGETVQEIRLNDSGLLKQLDFAVRCDDFEVSFYPNGTPKEFRSSLTILEGGKPVFSRDILVNHPLRYKGISLYLGSYGPLTPGKVTLKIKSNQSGMIYNREVHVGETFALPEDMGHFTLTAFSDSAQFKGHPIGEAFQGIFTNKAGKEEQILLPVRFESFDRMRRGDFFMSVGDYESRYYTGIPVTFDPGVRVVYAGFIVMIAGCIITFFKSHQQLCVELVAAGGKSRVIVSGIANKQKPGMQMRVKKTARGLARLGLNR